MRYWIFGLLLLVGLAAAQECDVNLELEVVPDFTDAQLEASYEIDCSYSTYIGQVNNVRLKIPTGKGVVVKDEVGLLEASSEDPAYFKLTNKDAYYLLSARPRTGIVIGPYGNDYTLTVSYGVKDKLELVDENIRMNPSKLVVKPTLLVQKGNSQTFVDMDIRDYKIKVRLPEGAELKESSLSCKIVQGTLECDTDGQEIGGSYIVWRPKPLSEKVAQKGWPWVVVGIKTALAKAFGGFI